MNEKDLEWIDQYLEGKLSAEEEEKFHDRMKQDESFAEEVQLRKKMDRFLTYKTSGSIQMEDILKINKEQFNKNGKNDEEASKSHYLWILILIGLLVIVGIIYWSTQQNQNDTTPIALFEQYNQHQTLDIVSRGNNECDNSAIQISFNAANYIEALPMIERCLIVNEDDRLLQLAQGICYLELGQNNVAEQIFEDLSTSNSLVNNEGYWYLGLLQMRLERTKDAIDNFRLIPPNSSRYRDAQDILKKLQ